MGCNKSEEIYKPSIENYISKTKQLIEKKNFKGYASLIDFSTTKKIPSERGEIYSTDLKLTNHFANRLISIIRDDFKVLHYFIIIDIISKSETNNLIYSLSGRKIGAYKVINGIVKTESNTIKQQMRFEEIPVDFILDETPNPSQIDDEIIDIESWWSCTKECISDSHIACYLDIDCATMLMITNLGAGAATPKGLGGGTASIGIACGISCAFNSKMDLLPQY